MARPDEAPWADMEAALTSSDAAPFEEAGGRICAALKCDVLFVSTRSWHKYCRLACRVRACRDRKLAGRESRSTGARK
jgi:hypothetical protein